MPESEELSQKFLQINGETFYDDVRIFLGNINLITGKIFSILCSDLILGDVRCYDTMVSDMCFNKIIVTGFYFKYAWQNLVNAGL